MPVFLLGLHYDNLKLSARLPFKKIERFWYLVFEYK